MEEKTVRDIANVIDGDRGVNYPKTDDFSDTGYCVFLTAKNVTRNGFVFDEIQFVAKKIDEKLRNGKLSLFDIILTTRGTVGNIALYSDDIPYKNIRINSGMVIIRTFQDFIDVQYLYLYFRSYILQNAIEKIAFGSAQPQLTVSTIQKLTINFPSLPEQQKIADCFSSLDKLIAAHTKKLEALKSSKKGLMQRLFPAEGETVPKLRFPEFRDAGEWEGKQFGDICKFIRGPFGGALTKDIFIKDGYAVYEQSHAIHSDFSSFRYFITNEKYKELKRFSVEPNDIIMSCSGTMGRFSIIPKKCHAGVINQALLKLTVKYDVIVPFVKMILELPLNQEKLLSQSAGGAIKNVVGVDLMKEIEFMIPSLPEQQKIADCLSSLDSLVADQSRKIESLKLYKKGLMQGLFPSADEANE